MFVNRTSPPFVSLLNTWFNVFKHNIQSTSTCFWPYGLLFENRTVHPRVLPFNHVIYCLQKTHPIHWCHFLTMWFIRKGPLLTAWFINELIRFSIASGCCQDFLDQGFLPTKKPINQGYLLVKLKSSFRTFFGRNDNLVSRYGISVLKITTDIFHLSYTLPSPLMTYHRISS